MNTTTMTLESDTNAPEITTSDATVAGAGGEDTVELTLDGRPCRMPAGTRLDELLRQFGYGPGDVGTAVNGNFVARDARAAHRLRAGDAVLLFQPIVGG